MTDLLPNITDYLARQAERTPEAPALLSPQGRLDFRSLDALVWRIAAHLRDAGVRAGEVVALRFASEATMLATLLAVARIGATAFSLPGALPRLMREAALADSGADVLAFDTADDGPGPDRRVFVDPDALMRRPVPVDTTLRVDAPTAPCLLITGSGSTGRSKTIPLTHAQFAARLAPAIAAYRDAPPHRILSLIHLDQVSAKNRCLDVLFNGGSVLLPDRRRVDVVGLCRDGEVSILFASVFHVETLLRSLPDDARDVLAGLRMLYVGSSLVSDALRERIARQLTPNLYVRYGTNETGLISLASPADIAGTPGTVGRVLPAVQAEVVDDEGRARAPGEVGLLRVRSPGMIDGYVGDPEATRKAFRDGWFITGDLARMTSDGQLVYFGRADHMMIMDGINIYPAEIEHTLCGHPAVRDAAAMPVPSAMHQDIPVCAVALREGAQAEPRALLGYAVARLGARAPRQVVVLDRIPRTELGKLVRPALARALAAALRPVAPGERGARQPMRRLRLELPLPPSPDIARADDWLARALELPARQPAPPARDAAASATAMLERCLRLAGALLRAARIPAFDDGEVLALEPVAGKPGRWLATVTLPDVARIDPGCTEMAIREAVQLLRWMMQTPRDVQRTTALHARLERVTAVLARRVTAGKSTLPLLKAAHDAGLPFIHLGSGVYQLGWGSRALRVDRSTTGADPAIGAALAQSKAASAALLAAAGLPAPLHAVVSRVEEARAAAGRIGWPVVVKPLDRDAGVGVTVGVESDAVLASAFEHALTASRRKRVIVERQVPGVCHRLFVAADRLLYAVKRLPKSVQGDGRSTVAQLVEQANQQERARPPWLRTEVFPMDALARATMAGAGFDESSVPAAGALVPLRPIESTEWGGFDEEVGDRIHPDNLDLALRTARLFGLQVAGVDIITEDIGVPWHASAAIVNEVNFAPLLGGGEISRRHLPEYLSRLVRGDGRIPVEAVLGDDAGMRGALARQQALKAAGLRCHVTSHRETVTDSGRLRPMPFTGLDARAQALLLDDRVDAIVLSIRTDELLHGPWPVDRLTRITRGSTPLADHRNPGRPADPQAAARLQTMLQSRLSRGS